MPAPEPTTPTPPPAEDPQGSLGAVLIGGAILVVAALLIFWPDGDSASRTDGAGGRGNSAQANSGGGASGSGQSKGGVGARDHDPAEGKVNARINPALQMSSRTMAPSRPPPPEPTSFNSPAEEIAYFEKKLEQARADLEARSTFLERMKKVKDDARTPADQSRAQARGEIVQKNYDDAMDAVADLEKKLAELRKKQGAAG